MEIFMAETGKKDEADAVAAAKPREIRVAVNEHPVLLSEPEQTGLSIKQAAIKQGVAIQLDFVLSIELGGGRTELVGDNEKIKVHEKERFLAIPNDDNS
jgi:ribosomal protein S9